MSDLLVYWRDYKQNWIRQFAGERAYYWHSNAKLLGELEPGDHLWYRSSRIVPEPFFVHSDLTTGVFLADLAAYILGWGWRLSSMTEPVRDELRPFANKLHEMQFHGQKPKVDGGTWPLHGIVYMDDLRGQFDKP